MTASTACAVVVLLTLAAGPALAQARAGGELRLAPTTDLEAGHAGVAVGPAGQMMVVWDAPDGSRTGIFGRRLDSAGRPLGAEFQISSNTPAEQLDPTVVADPRGGYLVVWTQIVRLNGSVIARRYDADGRPQAGEFVVALSRIFAGYPSAAFDGAGNFVVAWHSTSVNYGADVVARRYDASGAAQGGQFFPVSGPFEQARLGARVVCAPAGDFIVTWSEYERPPGQSGTFHVHGQRFDASTARLGAEFRLDSGTSAAAGSVAMAADGSFVATWFTGIPSIVARRFDPAGHPRGAEFAVNETTEEVLLSPTVAADGEGGFAIAWSARHFDGRMDVNLRRYDRSGQLRGSEQRVNTTLGQRQLLSSAGPPLVDDGTGNLTVVWDGDDPQPGRTGLFGQRYGGLQAAAVRVDTGPGGDGILEPGETVDVRPSWRNASGAARAFGGTLVRVEGPAGATYTIDDGTGAYGTVADGGTGACTDCYGVSVSAPATRPATHWDALAVERLTPDEQGQVKRWPLHVGGSFTDVPAGGPFYAAAETLLHRGVTAGCNADHFCPGLAVTRAQMAVFVLVAREGNAYLPPACAPETLFDDVPAASPYCRWVEELARRGVVSGCGPRLFCPADAVSRDQMAVFLLRTLDPALDPPACAPPNTFADVPETSAYCRWIEELARRGITGGCGGGNYCPAAPVARDQMAAFLATTFGLSLYGL